MTEQAKSATARYTMLLCTVAALALAGCEQHPYPTPSYDAPPPAPPAAADATGSAPSAAPTPAQPDAALPAAPSAAPQTPSPVQPQSPATEAYSPDGSMPGGVMAPIPNPSVGHSQMDDTQTWADRRAEGRRHHRRHTVLQADHHLAAAPHATAGRNHIAHPAKHAPAKPVVPPIAHKGPTHKPTPTVAKPDAKADRTRHLDALQLALGEALSHGATLTPPQGGSIGQAALVLSPGFTDAVRKAAVENGLTDADAPITATAGLSADNYTSQSPLTQVQPLKAGQATEFHWALTPRAGSTDPLKANLCVTVASGPELICGGAVQANAPVTDNNGRIFGLGLLLLIGGVVVGWFVRGRGAPAAKPSPPTKPTKAGW